MPGLLFCYFTICGVLMLQGLKNVNFDDMDQMLPVSIMLIGMPISGSIGHAIGLGLISYAVVKLLSGKAKDVSVADRAGDWHTDEHDGHRQHLVKIGRAHV